MNKDGHLLIVCQSDNWRSLRSDIEKKYLYIPEDLAQKRDDEPVNSATNFADKSDDDDFIDDPYYADCRQRDLNNEFMTDKQVDELLQSDEDFDE